jgi:DNA-binding Xre family transcriptional regulator
MLIGGLIVSVSYKKLWKLMIDKEITKTQLRKLAHISPATAAKLSKSEVVSLESLLKISEVLNCSVADIVDSTPSGMRGQTDGNA